jgi:hypothetical protein
MRLSEDLNRLPIGAEMPRAARKPYQRPAMRFERVFETRALTCGKVNPTQGSCTHNRKNS